MEHPINSPYAVQINSTELKTSGRRAEVARLLLAGKKKQDIIDYLMETFGMEYNQAKSEYRQGYVYIYLNAEQTKEEIRQLSLARLEQLWEQAEEDEMLESKDYYKVQMRNVDLMNKTALVYENEKETTPMTGEFTVNLGTIKQEKGKQ